MKKIFLLVFALILIIFAQGASAKILDISLSENNFQLLQGSEIEFDITYTHGLPGKLLQVETTIEAPEGIQVENSAGQYHEFYYSQKFQGQIHIDKDTNPGLYEVEITTKTKADKQIFSNTEKMHIEVLENKGIVYKTEKTSTKEPEIANVTFSDYVIALTRAQEKEFTVEFENLGSESNFVPEYSDSNPFVKIDSANKEFLSSTGGKIFFTAKANALAEKGNYLIPISLRDKASGQTHFLGAIKIVVEAFYNIDISSEPVYEVNQGIAETKEFTVKNLSGFETNLTFAPSKEGIVSFPE
ncbi:MAG: hypothetical protein Q7K42_01515, partial [Candidatus Diapherotrites archaeon]|nr:hypothetical protein [Candidatus Diapherotrites archaeon]